MQFACCTAALRDEYQYSYAILPSHAGYTDTLIHDDGVDEAPNSIRRLSLRVGMDVLPRAPNWTQWISEDVGHGLS